MTSSCRVRLDTLSGVLVDRRAKCCAMAVRAFAQVTSERLGESAAAAPCDGPRLMERGLA